MEVYFKEMIKKKKTFMPRNNVSNISCNIFKVKQVKCLQIGK